MPEPMRLYPVVRARLDTLSDGIGIMQHAVGAVPDPAHGYCTDDVARAVLVDLAQAPEVGWAVVATSVARAVRFLQAAFEPGDGRFRNLLSADGAWTPAPFSEDAHGRAMHGLGEVIAVVPDLSLRASAMDLFEQALPATARLRQPRPQAAALIGCEAALRGGMSGAVVAVHERLTTALAALVDAAATEPAWPWPEGTLTYENGLLPEALLVAGRRLGDQAIIDRGRLLLDWLIEVETAPAGHISVVGNAGWWPRGGQRARYDQQPIEVTALLLAAATAADVAGAPDYDRVVERCYAWFLGANDGDVAVAIPDLGSCQDGLTPSGPNPNQGAESTLAWLMALEVVRRRRAHPEIEAAAAVLARSR